MIKVYVKETGLEDNDNNVIEAAAAAAATVAAAKRGKVTDALRRAVRAAIGEGVLLVDKR